MARTVKTDHDLSYADGVIAAAGHKIDDPVVNEIRRQAQGGDIDAEEAIELIRSHIQGSPWPGSDTEPGMTTTSPAHAR